MIDSSSLQLVGVKDYYYLEQTESHQPFIPERSDNVIVTVRHSQRLYTRLSFHTLTFANYEHDT